MSLTSGQSVKAGPMHFPFQAGQGHSSTQAHHLGLRLHPQGLRGLSNVLELGREGGASFHMSSFMRPSLTLERKTAVNKGPRLLYQR